MKLTDPSDWTIGTGTDELNGLDDFDETITDSFTHLLTNGYRYRDVKNVKCCSSLKYDILLSAKFFKGLFLQNLLNTW